MDIFEEKKETVFEKQSEIEINKSKNNFFEKITVGFFYALIFLLPVFVLPMAISPVSSSKITLLSFGGLFLLFFWLISKLKSSAVKIPKSLLLASAGGIVLIWLFSSLFSGNIKLSLVGKLYDLDTFSVITFLSIILFLSSVIFQSEKRILNLYLILLFSSIFAFLFQFFHLVLGFNILPFNDIFPYTTSNLVGGWNDLSIFFGFIGLVSLIFLEMFKFQGWMKILIYVTLAMSLLMMAVSNFTTNWIVFGIFTFALFIFLSIKSSKPLRPSLFIFLIVLMFIIFNGQANKIGGALKISFIEARPSFPTTLDIIKKNLKTKALLGSGPNTFLYKWMEFKPSDVNETVFWNARFSSGFGYAPSIAVTVGILGIFVFGAFIFIFLAHGLKIISVKKNSIAGLFLTMSFVCSVYLWSFVFLYNPGAVVLFLAFMLSGVTLATAVKAEKIKTIDFVLMDKKKKNLFTILTISIILMGIIFVFYGYSKRVLAMNNYGKALKIFNLNGDLDGAVKKMMKSANQDKQDEYFRALSEAGLLLLNQIISDTKTPKENLLQIFQNTINLTASYAEEAKKINPREPLNWMQAGRIYESFLPLKVENAENMAILSYEQAAKISPADPTPVLALGRVAIQSQKIAEAKNHLQKSLEIKKDYLPALFLLAQVEMQSGNIKEAIAKTEQAANFSQNDPGIFFQLGLMYYQIKEFNKAGMAFERAIMINKDYANARYFLGLVYDRMGMRNRAIEQFEIIQETNQDNEEVKKILANLRSDRSALSEVSPPAPEKRSKPPINDEDEEEGAIKKKSKKN